jgi:hypothetical protein
MKKIILAVILIAVLSLPAFADSPCGVKYQVKMATVMGETIYRVVDMDGFIIVQTNDLRKARLTRDLNIASCRAEIKMKEREKAMKDAVWEEVE